MKKFTRTKPEISSPASLVVPQLGGRKPTTMIKAGMIISLMAITGCASYNKDHFTVGSVPDDYRTRHPIVVSEDERAVDIIVPSRMKKLPLRERDIVRATGYKFKSSGAKSMAILIPAGSPNEQAARNAANDAVHELKSIGISSSQIMIHHYQAGQHGAAATLRLVYTGLTAGVDSKCGEWTEDLTATKNNRNYANFGCATQNNLAQMIANPSDLVGPRGMTEIDSTKRTAVIDEWRNQGSNLDLSDFVRN